MRLAAGDAEAMPAVTIRMKLPDLPMIAQNRDRAFSYVKIEGDADAAGAQRIRQSVAAAGGHATLFRGGDKTVGVFHPLAPAVAVIHQRLARSFDPAGIFNPHRMY